MKAGKPQPRGKLPGSPDFLAALAFLAFIVVCSSVGMSDSAPRALRHAATLVMMPIAAVLMIAIWGGLLVLPAWAMWRGARAADARRLPPGGILTVAPDEGPLAPADMKREKAVPFAWTSTEWILSGLGIVGEAGGVASLLLGMNTAASFFGGLFLLGAGGWIVKLNVEHIRRGGS